MLTVEPSCRAGAASGVGGRPGSALGWPAVMATRLVRTRSGLGFLIVLVGLAALLGSSAVVRADAVAAGSAGPVRMITYNVCGAYQGDPARPGDTGCRSPYRLDVWARVVEREVAVWDADVVLLQELCFGQWAALGARLRGYQPVWVATKPNAPGCRPWVADGDHRFGMGVFVRAAQPVRQFQALLTPLMAVPAGEEVRAVLCARAPVDGRTTLVCTTHLSPSNYGPDQGTAQVMTHIAAWSGGAPVILGGDFNATPEAAAMDPVHRGTAATGPFTEVDGSDRAHFRPGCRSAGATECRSGEPTFKPSGGTKLDHLFVSTRHFDTVGGQAVGTELTRVRPDHLLLRGAAAPR